MPKIKPPISGYFDRANPLFRSCGLYLPMWERVGSPMDLVSRQPGTLTGVPTWSDGPAGPQMDGFTTANFVDYPPLPLTYPYWLAVLYRSGGGNDGYMASYSTAASVNGYAGLRVTDSTGTASWAMKNDGGSSAPIASAAGLPTGDGHPHVVMGACYATNDIRMWFDGVQKSALVNTLGTITPTFFTVGCLKRNSPVLGYGGKIIAVAAGLGGVPDPAAFAWNWLSGDFAEIRKPPSMIRYFYPSSGPVFSPAWVSRQPTIGSGVY